MLLESQITEKSLVICDFFGSVYCGVLIAIDNKILASLGELVLYPPQAAPVRPTVHTYNFLLFLENKTRERFFYKGPEIPCLRIIRKCSSINTAINQGKTKVCRL